MSIESTARKRIPLTEYSRYPLDLNELDELVGMLDQIAADSIAGIYPALRSNVNATREALRRIAWVVLEWGTHCVAVKKDRKKITHGTRLGDDHFTPLELRLRTTLRGVDKLLGDLVTGTDASMNGVREAIADRTSAARSIVAEMRRGKMPQANKVARKGGRPPEYTNDELKLFMKMDAEWKAHHERDQNKPKEQLKEFCQRKGWDYEKLQRAKTTIRRRALAHKPHAHKPRQT